MIKRQNKTWFCFSLLISFCSCILVTGEDQKLTMSKEINDSQKLRLDGYYFRPNCDENKKNCVYDIFFLFRNGVIFTPGVVSLSEKDFKNIGSKLTNEFFETNADLKFRWGLYEIDGESIVYEKWYAGSGKNYVYLKTGRILNDTTFEISNFKSSHKLDNGFDKQIKETYHFVEFANKPDSTTAFIE